MITKKPFTEEFPVIEKDEPHIITRPIIEFNKPKETAAPMPDNDFLNPYKNQAKEKEAATIKSLTQRIRRSMKVPLSQSKEPALKLSAS